MQVFPSLKKKKKKLYPTGVLIHPHSPSREKRERTFALMQIQSSSVLCIIDV